MQLAFFKACGSDLRPDRGLQRGPAKRCGKPLPGDVSLCERRRCVVVLVGHFVPQQIVVAAWGAKRSSPKARLRRAEGERPDGKRAAQAATVAAIYKAHSALFAPKAQDCRCGGKRESASIMRRAPLCAIVNLG